MIFPSKNILTGLYKHTNLMRNKTFYLSQNFRFGKFKSNSNIEESECVRKVDKYNDFNEF